MNINPFRPTGPSPMDKVPTDGARVNAEITEENITQKTMAIMSQKLIGNPELNHQSMAEENQKNVKDLASDPTTPAQIKFAIKDPPKSTDQLEMGKIEFGKAFKAIEDLRKGG